MQVSELKGIRIQLSSLMKLAEIIRGLRYLNVLQGRAHVHK